MTKIVNMRQEYTTKGLHRKDLEPNPIKQFETWFNQAIEAEILEPNAFSLATVGDDMMPSIRTVLLKMYDEEGFVFFSNFLWLLRMFLGKSLFYVFFLNCYELNLGFMVQYPFLMLFFVPYKKNCLCSSLSPT